MPRARILTNDEVLAALVQCFVESPVAPSLRELAGRLGIASASTLYPYLNDLRDAGLIRWVPGHLRTLELLRRPRRAAG